jgi:hypothetical protein
MERMFAAAAPSVDFEYRIVRHTGNPSGRSPRSRTSPTSGRPKKSRDALALSCDMQKFYTRNEDTDYQNAPLFTLDAMGLKRFGNG